MTKLESATPEEVIADLDRLLQEYREEYTAYYERCKDDDSPALRDPFPVIVLVPRVGLLSFAKDKATARIAAEFYVNAINVMRGAESLSKYDPISDEESAIFAMCRFIIGLPSGTSSAQ